MASASTDDCTYQDEVNPHMHFHNFFSCYVYIQFHHSPVYLPCISTPSSIPPTPLPETKCPHRQKPGPARDSTNCRKSRTLRPFSFLFSLYPKIETDEKQTITNANTCYTHCQEKESRAQTRRNPICMWDPRMQPRRLSDIAFS